MEVHGLLDILLILVAAKAGAEISERIGIPAVIGEITAGLLLGPSLLGWVETTESIALLAEIGVILLLLQVGMEMDLREMGKVGGASLGVAFAGIAAPFALGYGVATAFGHGGSTALFLGAALTATSVGITARAFGDLRILSSTESRIVLGAAVADDVLGLVILTVVVRVVDEGTLDVMVALRVLAVALAFLVVATVLGLRIAPPVFRWIQRSATGTGTLLIGAVSFTLALALLAGEADLAPIIGAFVAGLALGRTKQAERIERDLNPLANLFIPIFFVQVGLQVDVKAMIRPSVLGLAGALLAVAVIGKVVAGWAVGRTPVDRLLVGIGMIPRGEVGLIFATLGLANGVLDDDLYAAMLVVVLVTTIVTPGLIRFRLRRSPARPTEPTTDEMPTGGWLSVTDGTVDLNARPSAGPALGVALEAARLADTADPSPALVSWMAEAAETGVVWDDTAVSAFTGLLASGSRRSWRLLDATGLLAGALPDLADELEHRRHDTTLLDPAHLLRWPTVERLAEVTGPDGDDEARAQASLVEDRRLLTLAALAIDLAGETDDVAVAAGDLARDLGLAPEVGQELVATATDAALLRMAAAHLVGLDTAVTPDLVAHVATVDRARRLYVLAVTLGDLDEVHREALDELFVALRVALVESGEEAPGPGRVERRRAEAAALTDDARIRARITKAPAVLLLAEEAADLVADLAPLSAGVPHLGHFHVRVSTEGPDRWRVAVVARDTPGLLARVAAALADEGLSVSGATLAAYPDGAVVDVFRVSAAGHPDAAAIEARVLDAFHRPLHPAPVERATVTVDRGASPWFTVCTVTAPDRPGLLQDLAATLASLDLTVHSARIGTVDGVATDRFDLTTRKGRKLDDALIDRLGEALADRHPTRPTAS